MTDTLQISIIIVSYNVCDLLFECLISIKKALQVYRSEIVVVDNASSDDSVKMIKQHFPDITLIENKNNRGFAGANNQALEIVKGNYVVLINPDTIVQEDVFSGLFEFMEANTDAGCATCKLLNPDGSFSIDSRHSIPTPSAAFWKFIGFDKLFPDNSVFAKYNLTYLNKEKTYPIDAVSGSFMFLRKTAIDQVGMFDEDYFMYCEDIDYCVRLNKSGWTNYYVPVSNVLHFKGESSKKNYWKFVKNFQRSLYVFYKKHFSGMYFKWFGIIVFVGLVLRGISIYLKSYISLIFGKIKPKRGYIIAGKYGFVDKYTKKSDSDLYGVLFIESEESINNYKTLKIYNEPDDLFTSDIKKVVFITNEQEYKSLFAIMDRLKNKGFQFHFKTYLL